MQIYCLSKAVNSLLLTALLFAIASNNTHAQHSHYHGEGNMRSHAGLYGPGYHRELRGSYTAEQPSGGKAILTPILGGATVTALPKSPRLGTESTVITF